MERTMSVEEKIRRAEEIYNRKRENQIRPNTTRVSVNSKKDIKLLKKMIIQIIVCLSIYSIFYLLVEKNYIFSQDLVNKTREILSYDINFEQLYNNIIKNINSSENTIENMQGNGEESKVENEQKNNEIGTQENLAGSNGQPEENTVESNDQSEENAVESNGQSEGNAVESNGQSDGNAIESNDQSEGNIVENNGQSEENGIGGSTEEVKELSQMEQDSIDIKNAISFIIPVEGTISSTFGWRNPTTETVPKNHTGLDIAISKGTVIKSATNGTVILSSSQGDYGNHLKIQIEDVTIIYAHCDKLYVKEGDVIVQGQPIAEVGSTGNSTGPHLHFEIRINGSTVNPQKYVY